MFNLNHHLFNLLLYKCQSMTICFIEQFFIHLNFFGSSLSCNGFSLCVLTYIILSDKLHLLTRSLVPKRLSCVINSNHLLTFYIIALLNCNCKRILMRFCYNYFFMKMKSNFYSIRYFSIFLQQYHSILY